MPTKSSSPKAQKKVAKVMHEFKRGTLKSGRSNKKVTSRKQAVAIGLSEAREAGANVPTKRKPTPSKRKASTRKAPAKKRVTRKPVSKKKSSKKASRKKT